MTARHWCGTLRLGCGVLRVWMAAGGFLGAFRSRYACYACSIQLQPDTFNFNMEGRGLRDLETLIQHQTLGQGREGTDFQTIFVGPTPIPGR
jgi:hypothetical protein